MKNTFSGSGTTRPAFTLATYVHLLNDDLGEPLGAPCPASANARAVLRAA